MLIDRGIKFLDWSIIQTGSKRGISVLTMDDCLLSIKFFNRARGRDHLAAAMELRVPLTYYE